jgi:hypothetical protein
MSDTETTTTPTDAVDAFKAAAAAADTVCDELWDAVVNLEARFDALSEDTSKTAQAEVGQLHRKISSDPGGAAIDGDVPRSSRAIRSGRFSEIL